MDFDTLLKFINELSGHIDIDAILRDAEALCVCAGATGAASIPPGTPPSLPVGMKVLNDALMGILKVCNLTSPPYVSTNPAVHVHRISKSDRFVVLGSDGLFDYITNEEVVQLVDSYLLQTPDGDPAKYLLEQLVIRAANCAVLNSS